MLVARVEAYERPLRYGEVCEVELVLKRLDNSSAVFGFRLFGDGELKSRSRVVYVSVDGSLNKTEIPPAARERLRKFLMEGAA